MKKLLLVTAIAALSVSAANAAPTLYGKAFLAADYVNLEFDSDELNEYDRDTNSVQINSHASRIGIKGSEAMTANTDVIYQLEYGTRVDGDVDGFKNRDTFLGIKNNTYGEFRVGKNQSSLDKINNVVVNQGYWDNLGSSKIKSNEELGALNMADSGRINSSVIWMAPKYNNLPLQLTAMYSSDDVNNNDNDGFGVAMMFDQGTGFTAGLAYDKDQNIVGDIIRGTATVDMSKYVAYPITLGALYQHAKYDDIDDAETEKGLVVSGEMGLTNFARPASVYAQYNKTNNLSGIDDADSNQIVVGGKYFYQPNIIMHAYAGMNKADDIDTRVGSRRDEDTGLDIDINGKGDIKALVIGTGLEYKF